MSTHSNVAAAARTFLFVLYFNMVRIPVEARDFPLLQNVQTGSGAHRASYSVGTGTFPRGRDVKLVDNPPLAIPEVRCEWSYTSAPPICLHGDGRDNFTFTTKFVLLYVIWEI
jgi:hypothetical protein